MFSNCVSRDSTPCPMTDSTLIGYPPPRNRGARSPDRTSTARPRGNSMVAIKAIAYKLARAAFLGTPDHCRAFRSAGILPAVPRASLPAGSRDTAPLGSWPCCLDLSALATRPGGASEAGLGARSDRRRFLDGRRRKSAGAPGPPHSIEGRFHLPARK